MKEEGEEEEEKERLVDTECVQGAASIHLAPAFESHQHTSVFAGRPGCLSPYLPLPPPMAIAPLFNSYDPLGVGFVSVGSIGMREVVVGWVGGRGRG